MLGVGVESDLRSQLKSRQSSTVPVRLSPPRPRSTPHSSPRPNVLVPLGTTPTFSVTPSLPPALTALGWTLASSRAWNPAWNLNPRPTLSGLPTQPPALLVRTRKLYALTWSLGRPYSRACPGRSPC